MATSDHPLVGCTIEDHGLVGTVRRGRITHVDTERMTVTVLWPGGYNDVDARREPGRFKVVQAPEASTREDTAEATVLPFQTRQDALPD